MARPRPRSRPREPGLWALFSAGGMLAALVLPALAVVLWIAHPLGWVELSAGRLGALARHPLARVALFGFVGLCLFHWAHRFRYTLYDGLQLYHLNRLIAVLTYGTATAGALAAGWVLLAL